MHVQLDKGTKSFSKLNSAFGNPEVLQTCQQWVKKTVEA